MLLLTTSKGLNICGISPIPTTKVNHYPRDDHPSGMQFNSFKAAKLKQIQSYSKPNRTQCNTTCVKISTHVTVMSTHFDNATVRATELNPTQVYITCTCNTVFSSSITRSNIQHSPSSIAVNPRPPRSSMHNQRLAIKTQTRSSTLQNFKYSQFNLTLKADGTHNSNIKFNQGRQIPNSILSHRYDPKLKPNSQQQSYQTKMNQHKPTYALQGQLYVVLDTRQVQASSKQHEHANPANHTRHPHLNEQDQAMRILLDICKQLTHKFNLFDFGNS